MRSKKRGRNLNDIIESRKARRRDRLRALLLALLLVGGAAAVFVMIQKQRNRPYEDGRVVVVPFDNRTGDTAFDTLGLVASDWATRILSIDPGTHQIVPTTTTVAYQRSARLGRFDPYNRAAQIGRGTRAQLVVWGSFYRSGDSLRFAAEISDLKTQSARDLPAVAGPLTDPMLAVDRLRSAVVGAIRRTESVAQPIKRRVPELDAYQSFVTGLQHYVARRYSAAAADFGVAAARDTSYLPHQVWIVDALRQARQFRQADSAANVLRGTRVTRLEEARAMRAFAQLHGRLLEAHRWSFQLTDQNPADDFAQYELALSALALNRAREARRKLSELKPNYGFLHGRPDYYLNYAAAHHLLGDHHGELRVVRDGLMARRRALDVRLANCRVRAALGNEENALAALSAIDARDTEPSSLRSVGAALDDCAAELEAHGLSNVAARARELSRAWYARHSAPRTAPNDSIYERGYIALQQARTLSESGRAGAALARLIEALDSGLPYYEAGRMLLHAEPAFRRLRHTRGFLRINQPKG